jgi:hypothetical protein
MRSIVKTGLLVLAITVLQPAVHAQAPRVLFDGCAWSFPRLCDLGRLPKCCCPDDYCPKKLPCCPPCTRGCIDDYCCKKLPCVSPNPRGCVDDYCRKTCPIIVGSNCEARFTCGPPHCCTNSTCGNRVH